MKRTSWFQLVDDGGHDMARTDCIRLRPDANVMDLREAVKSADEDSLLKGIGRGQLLVFANRAAFDENRRMRAVDLIGALGESSKAPLIVQVPPRQPTMAVTTTTTPPQAPRLRWKPEPDLPPSLSHGALYFVNRDEAVEQLCQLHNDVFIAATRGVRPFNWWPIVLVDNESGMGKTTFGLEYIQRCREQWPAECNADGFQESLTACRTIRVALGLRALSIAASSLEAGQSPSTALEVTITDYLVTAIKDELDLPYGATVPEWLASPSTSAPENVLKAVVRHLGPVFIVLDGIGRAFAEIDSDAATEDADEKACTLFLEFCDFVLGTWMDTPGVYFVLTGYASNLRKVEDRNDEHQRTSRQTIIRLSLQVIRPPEIEEILRRTWTDSSRTQTLAQRWSLQTDKAIQEAAQIVYDKTCGHPRTMASALCQNETFEVFRLADIDGLDLQLNTKAWVALWGDLQTWRPLLKTWLNAILTNKTIDMSKDWSGPHTPRSQSKPQQLTQGTFSRLRIARHCDVGWEGTVTEAKLYARPPVLTAMILIVQPLRRYLRTISTNARRMTLTPVSAFEWACLKRFQELFRAPCSPHSVLPSFFGADTAFGQLDGVRFPETVTDWLTKDGSIGSWDAACWSEWPSLMRKLGAKLEASSMNSLCIKLFPRSLPTSAILVHRNDRATLTGGKRSHSEILADTVAVGLVVQTDTTTEFDAAALREECNKFAAMFVGLDQTTTKIFGTIRKMLIVCATRYSAEFIQGLNVEGTRYAKLGPNGQIDEVLLLDETTPEARSEFFGLTGDPKLANMLNGLIERAEQEQE